MADYYTSRFGDITVRDDEVVFFPEGLLGFGNRKEYALLEDPVQDPFLWLQSLEDPNLAFVLVDPLCFFPDYQARVPKEDVALLKLEDSSEARIFVLVVVSSDPSKITANLKGPLVVNPNKRMGKQMVLMDQQYGTQHVLLEQLSEREKTEC